MPTSLPAARRAALAAALALAIPAAAQPPTSAAPGATAPAPTDTAPAADRIWRNATIWTGVAGAPRAGALAVRGDRIVAVGSEAALRRLRGPRTVVIDLGGRLVVPGFDDAHWHFPSRERAALDGARDADELARRLRAFAAERPVAGTDPGWIVGGGWEAIQFPGRAPHRRWLDALFPDRPAALTDRDGHLMLANSRALALAGIGPDTPAPEGGAIDHDADGAATGVLRETAMGLVSRLLPPVGDDEAYGALGRVLARAAAAGLTAVQVASQDPIESPEHRAYRRALAADALRVRLRVAVPFRGEPSDSLVTRVVALRDSFPGPLLRFGILKGMLDGTVDGRTAAMLAPYEGPGGAGADTGLPRWTQDSLDRAVARWDSAGLQIELHAIGDRAIRMALDAYERAAQRHGTTGRRHRVEHVEVPDPADLPRFAALGVVASTQAIFATPDATTLENYAPLLGPVRAARANAFRRFDDAGAVQAFGSDFPVFPMDPLRGIHAAVTRTTPAGTPAGGWHPEHRISVEAAFRHYTQDAAWAAFAERERGTLEPGKLADFVVLSEDVLRAPPDRVLRARVLRTVMGGRETYRAPAPAPAPARPCPRRRAPSGRRPLGIRPPGARARGAHRSVSHRATSAGKCAR
jgi:predicted amidohydrolase YtcJ